MVWPLGQDKVLLLPSACILFTPAFFTQIPDPEPHASAASDAALLTSLYLGLIWWPSGPG